MKWVSFTFAFLLHRLRERLPTCGGRHLQMSNDKQYGAIWNCCHIPKINYHLIQWCNLQRWLSSYIHPSLKKQQALFHFVKCWKCVQFRTIYIVASNLTTSVIFAPTESESEMRKETFLANITQFTHNWDDMMWSDFIHIKLDEKFQIPRLISLSRDAMLNVSKWNWNLNFNTGFQ